MHSYNNGQYQASSPAYQYQILYTPSMEEYYTRFLEWVIEEDDLGLIIKSKKPVVQDTLPGIKTLIKQAVKTGRCYNIPDPFQTKPDVSFWTAYTDELDQFCDMRGAERIGTYVRWL